MKKAITDVIEQGIDREQKIIRFDEINKEIKYNKEENIQKIFDYLEKIVKYSHFLTSLTYNKEENQRFLSIFKKNLDENKGNILNNKDSL